MWRRMRHILRCLEREVSCFAAFRDSKLPAARLHEVLLFDGGGGEAFHATDDGF
jgi:hypothetical protein